MTDLMDYQVLLIFNDGREYMGYSVHETEIEKDMDSVLNGIADNANLWTDGNVDFSAIDLRKLYAKLSRGELQDCLYGEDHQKENEDK